MLWIPITLLAALAQTLRFMFQKRLRIATLSTGGATFARFLYAAPLIALVDVGYAVLRGYGLPVMDWQFWAFAAAGGNSPCRIRNAASSRLRMQVARHSSPLYQRDWGRAIWILACERWNSVVVIGGKRRFC